MRSATNRPGLAKARDRSSARAARVSSRIAIAALVNAVVADRLSNYQIGARLGLTEKNVREWRAGLKPMPLELVLSLPTELALELLGALQALVRDERHVFSPEQTERRLVACVGELAGKLDDALGDGALDKSERAELARLLRKIETQAGAAAHALRSGTEG